MAFYCGLLCARCRCQPELCPLCVASVDSIVLMFSLRNKDSEFLTFGSLNTSIQKMGTYTELWRHMLLRDGIPNVPNLVVTTSLLCLWWVSVHVQNSLSPHPQDFQQSVKQVPEKRWKERWNTQKRWAWEAPTWEQNVWCKDRSCKGAYQLLSSVFESLFL